MHPKVIPLQENVSDIDLNVSNEIQIFKDINTSDRYFIHITVATSKDTNVQCQISMVHGIFKSIIPYIEVIKDWPKEKLDYLRIILEELIENSLNANKQALAYYQLLTKTEGDSAFKLGLGITKRSLRIIAEDFGGGIPKDNLTTAKDFKTTIDPLTGERKITSNVTTLRLMTHTFKADGKEHGGRGLRMIYTLPYDIAVLPKEPRIVVEYISKFGRYTRVRKPMTTVGSRIEIDIPLM